MKKFIHFLKSFQTVPYIALKKMFHYWDSPRLLVCDTGLYLNKNDLGFITVAICGGYISKYPRLYCTVVKTDLICVLTLKYFTDKDILNLCRHCVQQDETRETTYWVVVKASIAVTYLVLSGVLLAANGKRSWRFDQCHLRYIPRERWTTRLTSRPFILITGGFKTRSEPRLFMDNIH